MSSYDTSLKASAIPADTTITRARTTTSSFMHMHARQLSEACEKACQAIAPAWPLDRSIAVNPHWSRIAMPVRQVAARMAVLADIRVFPPRQYILHAWQTGRIQPQDLDYALQSLPETLTRGITAATCSRALHTALPITPLPLLIDALDTDPQRHTRLSWRHAITHQVSQTCAAYFDQHQAQWLPDRTQGLYNFWRDTLQHDHGIGMLMGLPGIHTAIASLPKTSTEAEAWVMQQLNLPRETWADYLEAVLLTVNGWASWCAYLAWQAKLAQQHDDHLRELLAIRMAWGALLLQVADNRSTQYAFSTVQNAWKHADTALQEAQDALLIDEVWQIALEAGYQRDLAQRLLEPSIPEQKHSDRSVTVQAAFCIDVRSEPMRRALEAAHPSLETIGCAGFFGMPIAYSPLGTTIQQPQLPGLLAPSLQVTDTIHSQEMSSDQAVRLEQRLKQTRQTRLHLMDQWQAVNHWPGSAFSFVEAAGIGYLGKLGRWLIPGKKPRSTNTVAGIPVRYQSMCRPQLTGVSLTQQVALAERVLTSLGLTQHIAPLVLLVGHGSQSVNNAHASGLDCGACCGQTGEVNARSLAMMLNEPNVRKGLSDKGIVIPDTTWFVAALHNTTTDEIEGFDLDLLPQAVREQWDELAPVFGKAGDQVRKERAHRLGLDRLEADHTRLERLQQRANDGAQTRPEWGLAGNAAFLIAPRHKTRHCSLQGRSFLHDYDADQDPQGVLLEQLMTAPMLVTHWINWQYHASMCDPQRLGSGNKLLHNVVGGTLGVFEGNGGDLRIGLSRQSLHDGSQWVHEPLRLTVIIDAPKERIQAIIERHAVLQHLINNHWLYVWHLSDNGFQSYEKGLWSIAMKNRTAEHLN